VSNKPTESPEFTTIDLKSQAYDEPKEKSYGLTKSGMPKAKPGRKKGQKVKRLTASTKDLGLVHRRLMTILIRDIKHLMNRVSTLPLNKDQSTSLVAYLKLVKELRLAKVKLEEEELDKLTDEQLAELAYQRQPTKGNTNEDL
jgi:hypothetical protein